MLKHFSFSTFAVGFQKQQQTISLKVFLFFIRALAFKEWRGLHFYSSIHRMPAWVQSIFHIDFNEVRSWNWKMRGRMKISTCLLLWWCAKDHLQIAVNPFILFMFLSFEKNISVAIWTFQYGPQKQRESFKLVN